MTNIKYFLGISHNGYYSYNLRHEFNIHYIEIKTKHALDSLKGDDKNKNNVCLFSQVF